MVVFCSRREVGVAEDILKVTAIILSLFIAHIMHLTPRLGIPMFSTL
jgi:hypothetical protein